jgi:hypothetical protein
MKNGLFSLSSGTPLAIDLKPFSRSTIDGIVVMDFTKRAGLQPSPDNLITNLDVILLSGATELWLRELATTTARAQSPMPQREFLRQPPT